MVLKLNLAEFCNWWFGALSQHYDQAYRFLLCNTSQEMRKTCGSHCVKSVCIRSYSGPHFPAFRLNTERYSVSLHNQSEYGKMQTRITSNADTFYAVGFFQVII